MSVLAEILAGVAADLEQRMAKTSLDDLKVQADRQHPALDPMPAFRADGVSVIAEVKRASPSMGTLAAIKDPAGLAADYAAGGAAAISVVTEERRFGGTYLNEVALRVPDAARRHAALAKRGIVAGYPLERVQADLADTLLLAATELTTDNDIDRLVAGLEEIR